jgi:hypothetical protein
MIGINQLRFAATQSASLNLISKDFTVVSTCLF